MPAVTRATPAVKPTIGASSPNQGGMDAARALPNEAALQPHPVVFTGRAGEYFGIWIVNVLLTLLTLGVYSAWAKVRTKRYFYGNTSIAGESFDYHAKPTTILKGRIIAVVVLVAFNVLLDLHWATALIAALGYAVLIPWAIVRGFSFNANMTSHRSLRFHFEGRKRDAFMAYIVWPFLGFISLGALVPYGTQAAARFNSGHRYGNARFFINPPLQPFYKVFGWIVLIVAVPTMALTLIHVIATEAYEFGLTGIIISIISGPAIFIGLVALVLVPFIYRALCRNIIYQHTRLEDGHRFRSTVSAKRYTFIAVTNTLAILFTLGLAYPWASIRLTRYLADSTTVLAASDLGEFAAAQRDESGVASGEFLDLDGGFDLGL